MEFSIIVPTFNSRSTIVSTLKSAAAAFPSGSEIIVVDDGSDDDTLQRISGSQSAVEKAGLSCTTIRLKHTGNVSAVRNVGVRASSRETLVFLDSDVELATTWGSAVSSFLESHPRAGCVGGLVYLKGAKAQLYNAGMSFPGEISRVLYVLRPSAVSSHPYVVDVVSNVFALRRASFDSIYGFNEKIAWMGDETWLQLALREKSFRSYVVPAAVSWHLGNQPLPFNMRTLAYDEARHRGAFLEPFLVQRDFLSRSAFALCVVFNLARLSFVETAYFVVEILQGRPVLALHRLKDSIALGEVVVSGSTA